MYYGIVFIQCQLLPLYIHAISLFLYVEISVISPQFCHVTHGTEEVGPYVLLKQVKGLGHNSDMSSNSDLIVYSVKHAPAKLRA